MATYVATKSCSAEGTLVAAGDELVGVSPGCLESMLRVGLAAERVESPESRDESQKKKRSGVRGQESAKTPAAATEN